jgi:hypothetical protein
MAQGASHLGRGFLLAQLGGRKQFKFHPGQIPPRRKEDFDRKSPSKGEALHEMAGETGGLDKSTHTRIEEGRCGYEHFSSPGLTVEKNFGRTKLLKTSVPHFCSATKFRSASSGFSVKLKSRPR